MFVTRAQRLYRTPFAGLLLCACLHASFTCAYALARFYGGKTSLLDIGTFNQLLWNLLHHGVALSTTNPPFTNQNWFGFHFSPILLALVPFYAAWPHPELLQAVQSGCFAGAGVVLFYALRQAGGQPKEAWAGALLYWCNPYIVSAALWDFHEIALATLLVAGALWGLYAKRFGAFVACLCLLLITKEHYGLSVAGFGFLWGWRYGQWRRAGIIMAAGLAALAVIILIIMPWLNGGAAHPMLVPGKAAHLGRYSWLAEPGMLKIKIFFLLMFHGGISGVAYLGSLLLSGFLLPLAAPVYLLAATSDLAANLLSANPMPRYWAAYHSAPIIPVVILAAYRGYVRIGGAEALRSNPVCQIVAALTMLFYVTTDLHLFHFWELGEAGAPFDRAEVEQINRLIPEGGVSAQCNIASFFSGRAAVYPYPYIAPSVQTVILQLARPFAANQDRFNIPLGMNDDDYRGSVEALLADSGWHVAYWHAPWLVLARGPGQTDATQRADILAHLRALYSKGIK